MSKKLALGLSVFLAVVIALTATYAWFSATDSVTNRLETMQITDGSVTIFEYFEEPKDWQPGQEITKQVCVANNGDGAVLVRVSFEEAMSLLQQPSVGNDDAYADGDTTIPQIFNAKAYESWDSPEDAGLNVLDALPEDVELRVNKVTTNTGTPSEKTTYTIVPLYKIAVDGEYKDLYQRVTGDFSVKDSDLSVSNIQFWAFPGTTDTEAAWAEFKNPQTSAAPTVRADKTLIVHPITDTANKITMKYTTPTEIVSDTFTTGKWWYNALDGFFYYIGKVEAGTLSPMLLESLKLATDADNTYSGMRFDLIVNMEAIQNTKDAVTDQSGWKLDPASELAIALQGFCDT